LILRHVDWLVLLELLARADPIRLPLAGLVLSAQFMIMVWRWQIVIELLGGPAVSVAPLAIALGRSNIASARSRSSAASAMPRTISVTKVKSRPLLPLPKITFGTPERRRSSLMSTPRPTTSIHLTAPQDHGAHPRNSAGRPDRPAL
jgi:hypothetical protein